MTHALTPAEYQVRGFAWFADGWAVVTSPTPKEDDFSLPWTLRQVREEQPDTALWQGRYPLGFLSASNDGQVLAWTHSGAGTDKLVDELWMLEAGGATQHALEQQALERWRMQKEAQIEDMMRRGIPLGAVAAALASPETADDSERRCHGDEPLIGRWR